MYSVMYTSPSCHFHTFNGKVSSLLVIDTCTLDYVKKAKKIIRDNYRWWFGGKGLHENVEIKKESMVSTLLNVPNSSHKDEMM